MNYAMLADNLFNKGNFEDAIEYYNEALNQDPSNIDIYFSLIESYFYINEYEKANNTIKMAHLIKKDSPELLFLEANYNCLIGMYDTAIDLYEKAIELGFYDETIQFNIAKAYYYASRYEEAITSLTNYIDTNDNDFEACFLLMKIFIHQEKIDEIKKYIDILIEKFPNRFYFYGIKLEILMGESKIDEYKKLLDVCQNQFNNLLEFEVYKLKYNITIKNINEAYSILNTFFKDDYTDIINVCRLNLFRIEDKYEEAENLIMEYFMNLIDFEVFVLCEMILMNNSSFENMEIYSKSILEKTSDINLKFLAEFYYSISIHLQGDEEKAKKYFEILNTNLIISSSANPQNDYIRYMQLVSYMINKDFEKALKLSNYIEKMYPNDYSIYYLKSIIYLELGKTEDYEKYKEKAISINNLVSKLYEED